MKEVTLLCVLDTDNVLHEFEVIDDTLTNDNIDYRLIELLAKQLKIDIVDYFVLKEFRK